MVFVLILTINLKNPFVAKELKKFWKGHSLLLLQHLSHLCPLATPGRHLPHGNQTPDSLVSLTLPLSPLWGQSDLSVAQIPLCPFPVFPLISRTNVQLFPRQKAARDSAPCSTPPPASGPAPQSWSQSPTTMGRARRWSFWARCQASWGPLLTPAPFLPLA